MRNKFIIIHPFIRPKMVKNFIDYENIKKNISNKLSKNLQNISIRDIDSEDDNYQETDDLEYLYYKFCKKNKIEEIIFITVASFNSSDYSTYQLQSSSREADNSYTEIVNFFTSIIEDYTFIFRDEKSKNIFLKFFNFDNSDLNFDCISLFDFYDENDSEFSENDFYSIYEAKFQYYTGFNAPTDYEFFRIITEKNSGSLINEYNNNCAVHLCEFYKNILTKISKNNNTVNN
jgi:hypothetical protein